MITRAPVARRRPTPRDELERRGLAEAYALLLGQVGPKGESDKQSGPPAADRFGGNAEREVGT